MKPIQIKFMAFYKPTGEWFCDKQGNSWNRDETQINSKGKLFSKRPNFYQLKKIYIHGIRKETNKLDWQIVTVEVIETNREDL